MNTPYYSDERVTLHHGDCLDILRTVSDASVDAVVTDPPYGLEFMGKEWDAPWKAEGAVLTDPASVGGFQDGSGGNPFSRSRVRFGIGAGFQQWCELWATECLRVLKPGGHILAFGGTRTWHRLACAVEDAGFEIRDSIAWMYGSGFPKSLDVSKAIDKAQGTTGTYGEPKTAAHAGWLDRGRMRGEEGEEGWQRPWMQDAEALNNAARKYEPATPDARTWQGWGTALKPAFEPVVVARKPLTGTVAANVLAWGTGALNVDGCRIEGETRTNGGMSSLGVMHDDNWQPREVTSTVTGRWPANVVLDESQATELDTQSGDSASSRPSPTGGYGDHRDTGRNETFGKGLSSSTPNRPPIGDEGGASRFFYVAKADASERVRIDGTAHPTVKPLSLMRWLVRLVTPPDGTVLEPFAGSGTTVEACMLEGVRCIAIEREADYLPLIVQRVNRRVDPVAAVRAAGGDAGLFDLLDGDDTGTVVA